MRLVRLTWRIGGVGLVLSGVTGMLLYLRLDIGAVLVVILDGVFAAAVMVFAIGLSKEASVVARRPLGVTALIVVALWPLAVRIVAPFLPRMDSATYAAGLEAYRAAEDILTAFSLVNLVVLYAAALIGSIQIARAGAVPTLWRWAPLWAVIVSVAVLVFRLLSPVAATAGAPILSALDLIARTLGLGIVALALAFRYPTVASPDRKTPESRGTES